MKSLNVTGLVVALAATGCANLKVTKVSEEKRAHGTDHHIPGFRYYLSRPYVVVKEPVLVCEQTALYVVREPEIMNAPQPRMVPPCPPRVSRINSSSGAFEDVPETELKALRQMITKNPGVVQIGFKGRTPTTAPQIVAQPAVRSVADVDAASGQAAAVGGAAETVDTQAGMSGSGGVPSGVGDHLAVPAVAADNPPTDRNTARLSGSIEVVFLPDLDEQYAVHNKNILSKSAYNLYFRDGWELSDVSGEFDSTVVPIEILNFIDRAIDSAKTVALSGVNQQARLLGASGADARATKQTEGYVVYQVVTTTFLKPGVYRINKPWEMGDKCAAGCGLLAKLGLATFETTRIEPATSVSLEPPSVKGQGTPKAK